MEERERKRERDWEEKEIQEIKDIKIDMIF